MRKTRHNRTYPKAVVQWSNQSLCWVDSLVLRNRHLRVAANCYALLYLAAQMSPTLRTHNEETPTGARLQRVPTKVEDKS